VHRSSARSCDDGDGRSGQGATPRKATYHRREVRVSELIRFGASPAMAKVWVQHVQELTEIQTKAVENGVFDGTTNLLVVAPWTAPGSVDTI
jgi:superfamily II helicase